MKQFIHRLIVCGVLGCALFGSRDLWATIVPITITNPGMVATVNSNFTYNSNNYLAGTEMPAGLYINTLDGTGTGTIRKISDDLPVAPGVTATVTGWLPVGGTALDKDRAGIANHGVGDRGNLVTLAGGGYAGLNVGFTQTLPGSVQLMANYTYTLSMDLFRTNFNVPPTFFADLTVGGTPVGGTLVYNPPPNDATPGSAVVTYSAGASPLSGNLGILIRATDTSGNLTRIMFDNLTLQASIPEPSTFLLLGIGGLLLGWKRLRIA